MHFFKEVRMSTTPGNTSSLNRRSLLQRGAALGAGVIGLDLLAACGGSGPTTTGSTVVTASVDTLPPATNPGAVYVFNQVIKSFEQSHPGTKIVGKTDPYSPTTYFARLAAN